MATLDKFNLIEGESLEEAAARLGVSVEEIAKRLNVPVPGAAPSEPAATETSTASRGERARGKRGLVGVMLNAYNKAKNVANQGAKLAKAAGVKIMPDDAEAEVPVRNRTVTQGPGAGFLRTEEARQAEIAARGGTTDAMRRADLTNYVREAGANPELLPSTQAQRAFNKDRGLEEVTGPDGSTVRRIKLPDGSYGFGGAALDDPKGRYAQFGTGETDFAVTQGTAKATEAGPGILDRRAARELLNGATAGTKNPGLGSLVAGPQGTDSDFDRGIARDNAAKNDRFERLAQGKSATPPAPGRAPLPTPTDAPAGNLQRITEGTPDPSVPATRRNPLTARVSQPRFPRLGAASSPEAPTSQSRGDVTNTAPTGASVSFDALASARRDSNNHQRVGLSDERERINAGSLPGSLSGAAIPVGASTPAPVSAASLPTSVYSPGFDSASLGQSLERTRAQQALEQSSGSRPLERTFDKASSRRRLLDRAATSTRKKKKKKPEEELSASSFIQ